MNVTEVLIKARGRLEDPTKWFQGRLAEEPYDPDSAMCAAGTINWAVGGFAYANQWANEPDWFTKDTLAQQACDVLKVAVKAKSVPSWNDGNRTHKDILDGFDAAIKLSRGD